MKKVDYIIVGNGLAGTMLAFEMLKHNIKFHIIASAQKKRASEVAAGMINPLVFRRLTKSWLVDDLLPFATAKYRELEKLLEEEFYFEKMILKPLSSQEKELWKERKSSDEFCNYIFSIDDYPSIDNIKPAAGFGLVNGSGYVDLSKFLDLADSYFRTKNLTTDATVNFQQFIHKEKSFAFADITASGIVFCEGAYIRNNPLFQWIKMVPVKGEVLQILAPQLSEEYILNKKVFVLPVGNHHFKVGSTYEWKDLTNHPSEEGKNSIIERLEDVINCECQIVNHWAGVRPATIDRRPVLGVHPERSNLFVFNGLGTKGVMLAPYFASEMVKFIRSNIFYVNAEVSAERFYSENNL